jgi:hypothetical protein
MSLPERTTSEGDDAVVMDVTACAELLCELELIRIGPGQVLQKYSDMAVLMTIARIPVIRVGAGEVEDVIEASRADLVRRIDALSDENHELAGQVASLETEAENAAELVDADMATALLKATSAVYRGDGTMLQRFGHIGELLTATELDLTPEPSSQAGRVLLEGIGEALAAYRLQAHADEGNAQVEGANA